MLYLVVFLFGMAIGIIFAMAYYKDEMVKLRREYYIMTLRDEENGLD